MNYLVRQLCPMSVNPQLYLFYLNMNYFSRRQNVKDIIHRIYFVTFSKSLDGSAGRSIYGRKGKSISTISVCISIRINLYPLHGPRSLI